MATKQDKKNIRGDLKIIVIGTAGTGKTSFVNKWTKNIFNENYKATIVSEFGFKIVELKGKMYRIQLWDLAGNFLPSLFISPFRTGSKCHNYQNLCQRFSWMYYCC